MQESVKEKITELITINGAMGVNALARELLIPLSTLQNQLRTQDYFVLNDKRKWDLPENVVQNHQTAAIGNFEEVISAQLNGISSMSDLLINNVKNTIAILNAQKHAFTPVATPKTVNIHPRLIEVDENIKKTVKIFKNLKSKIPEEYVDLIMNVDWTVLTVDKGTLFVNGTLNDELVMLLGENVSELKDETVKLLEDYQKGLPKTDSKKETNNDNT